MQVKLQKMGNHDNLETNNKVNLVHENDIIIISKLKKKYSTLEERFEMFENIPNEQKGNIESFDWGEDLGNEKFY